MIWRILTLNIFFALVSAMASASPIPTRMTPISYSSTLGNDSVVVADSLSRGADLNKPRKSSGGFGDDDMSNPGTDGGNSDFGDGDMTNPDTEGSTGGFGDEDAGNPSMGLEAGDINADGRVNIIDLVLLTNILRGNAPDKYGTADVDNNGSVALLDLYSLVAIILHQNITK